MSRFLRGVLIAIFLLSIAAPFVSAQSSQPSGPTYEVQSGDTLYLIALKFNISVDDLVQANQIANPDILTPGTKLVIPGLEGVSGMLTTESIQLGQDLTGLSRFYQVPIDTLNRLNRLTSPAEVYTGASLIIPQGNVESGQATLAPGGSLSSGQSLLEYAALHQSNPWQLAQINRSTDLNDLFPNELLYVQSPDGKAVAGSPLSPLITALELAPLPLIQGSTAVIKISASQPLEISGKLNNAPLHFFANGDNQYVAIQGIYAMADPGLADFSLELKTQDGQTRSYQQMVLLQDGYYPKDPPLTVASETIDPAVTAPEESTVKTTVGPANPQRYWTGSFHLPVDEPYCIKSGYGNRRSYNGSDYTYFHTGLDYGVCANLNVLAPADGVVVFAGPLTVRGNATIIDHGWGIYSGLYHQAAIAVKVGDVVKAGQVIGTIGGTGRVTGPHLHWDLFVNGIQVNPQEWLDRVIP